MVAEPGEPTLYAVPDGPLDAHQSRPSSQPAVTPPPIPDPPPVALRPILALVDSWLLALESENKAPKTLDNFGSSMDLFIRWLHHHQHPVEPDLIDARLIRTWISELIRDRSAATARTRWNGLRSFFAWCTSEGEIAENPMTNVTGPYVEEKVVDMVSLDDLKRLIASCEGPRLIDRRDQALILMYADTGARLSELANLQVCDVDLRERVVKVMGKGRRERLVPFGARTARALDRYLRVRARNRYADLPALWLSGKDGQPMLPGGIQQMFRRRGKQVGIASMHPHLLRHGFADAWLRSGGSESDLMELAGWRSSQMVRRYAAATRAERAREAYKARSPMDNL